MAHPAFVVLTANGKTIEAEASEHDFAPENGIALVDYSQSVAVPFTDAGVSGKRSYKPISFRKRIDRASPLIAQALVQNQVVEADFTFFRAGTGGDVKEGFRVETTQGRVVSFHQVVDDVLDPALAQRPPLEEVGLTFRRISWTDLDGRTSFEDVLSTT